MPVKYIAITRDGKRVKGVIDVEEEREAERVLWDSGLIIVKLKKEKARGERKPLFPTLLGPKQEDILFFTRELASLLESGIPLPTSLKILRDEIRNKTLKDAIHKIYLDIETGTSLSKAFSKYPHLFPPIFPRLLIIGEETGNIPSILRKIAEHLERVITTRRKVKRALAYPIFVIAVGGMAVLIILNFALPALAGLFKEMGAELPLITRILIGIGDILKTKGFLIIISILIFFFLLFLFFRTRRGRRAWSSLSLRIPIMGRAVKASLLERFCSNLYLLLGSGIPLPEALSFSASAIENHLFETKIKKVREEVLKGSGFGKALEKASLFPPVLVQSASIGEETGNLEENLKKLSDLFREEADRALGRVTGLLEPAIILLLGGVVGFVAVGVVSSIYSLMGQIK